MKKKIVLLISILLLSGCSIYDEYKMPKNVKIDTNKMTYEVYSKHKIKELIKDNNVEILNNKEELNTNKTGKYTAVIKYKYKLFKYKLKVNYEVVDTLPPTLITSQLNYIYYLNDNEIDFCSNAKYIDNYDRKVKCSIEGDYDLTKEGSYDLKYIIKDNADNTTIQSFNLNVLDPENIEYSDEEDDDDDEDVEEGIKFSDVVKAHKNDNTMIGIDVSRWQGDIDFDKVKKAGAEFVIIRMAVSNGPNDEIGLDSFYKKNILKAKNAGLKVGVYVYTSASSKKEIERQAKFVRKELNKTKLDFPITYDFESWDEIQEYTLNKYDLKKLGKIKNILYGLRIMYLIILTNLVMKENMICGKYVVMVK